MQEKEKVHNEEGKGVGEGLLSPGWPVIKRSQTEGGSGGRLT